MKSKLAIWSFIFSLIPIALYLLFFVFQFSPEIIFELFLGGYFGEFESVFLISAPFSILAIVMGIMAFKRIRENNLTGNGLAISGIIIGSIIFMFLGFFWGLEANY